MSDDTNINPERIYTIGTGGRLLNVSPSTLRDLERRGMVACTRTPGGQRRFAGSELLRLQDESIRLPPKKTRPTSSSGAATTEDTKARQAWLGQLIAQAQRELPVDAPAEVRLQLAANLERALRNLGPIAPLDEVKPVIKHQVDQARRQAQQAQEQAQRREIKDELLDYAQAHLRRSIEGLPRRVVGAPGSLKRRHVRATLRDRLAGMLQKRLKGEETWAQVRDLADDFVAAWYVEQPRGPLIPDAVKVLAAGVIGIAGGAAAAAALDPRIRAGAAKLKEPLLSAALDLLKRFNTSPPPAPSPQNSTNQVTMPPQCEPSTRLVLVRNRFYQRNPGSYRRGTPTSREAAREGMTASDTEARYATSTSREAAQHESAGAPASTS